MEDVNSNVGNIDTTDRIEERESWEQEHDRSNHGSGERGYASRESRSNMDNEILYRLSFGGGFPIIIHLHVGTLHRSR